MGALNCRRLEVGIENGSDSVLARYNKGTTVSQNERAIAILRLSAIELEMDYIMFDPFVSSAELKENLEFLERNDLLGVTPDEYLFNAVRPYPGTTIREQLGLGAGLGRSESSVLVPPFASSESQTIYTIVIAYAQRIGPKITRATRRLVHYIADCERRADPATQLANVVFLRLCHTGATVFKETVHGVSSGTIAVGTTLESADLEAVRTASELLSIAEQMCASGPVYA